MGNIKKHPSGITPKIEDDVIGYIHLLGRVFWERLSSRKYLTLC